MQDIRNLETNSFESFIYLTTTKKKRELKSLDRFFFVEYGVHDD